MNESKTLGTIDGTELTDKALDEVSGGYFYSSGWKIDVIDDNTGEVLKDFPTDHWDEARAYAAQVGVQPTCLHWDELRDLRARYDAVTVKHL